MQKTTLIVTLAAAFAALHGAAKAQPRHPFPAHCTCRYNRLPSSCSRIDPESYPAHHHVFPSNDCLPDVPVNHRVCYMTKVRDCTDANDTPYYGCYLRVGGKRLGFKLAPLHVIGGNESQVFLDSVHNRTATEAVCFYNVSVAPTERNGRNCSGIALESASSTGSGGDASEVANSTDETAPCKSYVRVYYRTAESEQQEIVVCQKDLAGFYASIPDATSLFLVYWTNNDADNQGTAFRMRARCID